MHPFLVPFVYSYHLIVTDFHTVMLALLLDPLHFKDQNRRTCGIFLVYNCLPLISLTYPVFSVIFQSQLQNIIFQQVFLAPSRRGCMHTNYSMSGSDAQCDRLERFLPCFCRSPRSFHSKSLCSVMKSNSPDSVLSPGCAFRNDPCINSNVTVSPRRSSSREARLTGPLFSPCSCLMEATGTPPRFSTANERPLSKSKVTKKR